MNNIINFMYAGTVENASETPISGELRIDSSNNLFVYTGQHWEELGDISIKGDIISDLNEIINKYPGSEIVKDIRILLEMYKIRNYK